MLTDIGVVFFSWFYAGRFKARKGSVICTRGVFPLTPR
jgi:hypothetical protein